MRKEGRAGTTGQRRVHCTPSPRPSPGCTRAVGPQAASGLNWTFMSWGACPGAGGPAPCEAGYEWGPQPFPSHLIYHLCRLSTPGRRRCWNAGAQNRLCGQERLSSGRGGGGPLRAHRAGTVWLSGRGGAREGRPPATPRLCPPAALARAGSASGLRAMTLCQPPGERRHRPALCRSHGGHRTGVASGIPF